MQRVSAASSMYPDQEPNVFRSAQPHSVDKHVMILPYFVVVAFFYNKDAGMAAFASLLVGSCGFFQPYHFDAWDPHIGPFFLWFFKETACRAVQVI